MIKNSKLLMFFLNFDQFYQLCGIYGAYLQRKELKEIKLDSF